MKSNLAKLLSRISVNGSILSLLLLFGLSVGFPDEAKAGCANDYGIQDCIEKASGDSIHGNQPNSRYLCETEERCLVVYLSPWCPYCKAQVGSLNRLIKKARSVENLGIKIVVGAERRQGGNELMAFNFPPNSVIIDSDRKLASMLRIRAFPTYSLESPESTIQTGSVAYISLLKELKIPPTRYN